MSGHQKLEAIVSNRGRITLPVALRAKLGIHTGSRIRIELRGDELIIKPEPDMSAYRGTLKGYDLDDIEPESKLD